MDLDDVFVVEKELEGDFENCTMEGQGCFVIVTKEKYIVRIGSGMPLKVPIENYLEVVDSFLERFKDYPVDYSGKPEVYRVLVRYNDERFIFNNQ